MEKKDLEIRIIGKTNSGKSSLAYLLKELLKKEGMDIQLNTNIDYNDEDHFNNTMSKTIKERKKMLRDKNILISEINKNL